MFANFYAKNASVFISHIHFVFGSIYKSRILRFCLGFILYLQFLSVPAIEEQAPYWNVLAKAVQWELVNSSPLPSGA
jgi:hypothetical protein